MFRILYFFLRGAAEYYYYKYNQDAILGMRIIDVSKSSSRAGPVPHITFRFDLIQTHKRM